MVKGCRRRRENKFRSELDPSPASRRQSRSGSVKASRCGKQTDTVPREKTLSGVFGRRLGQRVKADRHTPRVLKLVEAGQSCREISHRLGISKNTVSAIVKRERLQESRAA